MARSRRRSQDAALAVHAHTSTHVAVDKPRPGRSSVQRDGPPTRPRPDSPSADEDDGVNSDLSAGGTGVMLAGHHDLERMALYAKRETLVEGLPFVAAQMVSSAW